MELEDLNRLIQEMSSIHQVNFPSTASTGASFSTTGMSSDNQISDFSVTVFVAALKCSLFFLSRSSFCPARPTKKRLLENTYF